MISAPSKPEYCNVTTKKIEIPGTKLAYRIITLHTMDGQTYTCTY